MSNHYYSGESPPPLPPPRGTGVQLPQDTYDPIVKKDSPGTSKHSPGRWSQKINDSFRPFVPKALQKSHDNNPPLSPRHKAPDLPPPLPSRSSKPQGHQTSRKPPQPLPVRAASFADPHSLVRRPPDIPHTRIHSCDDGGIDSDDGENYTDVSFMSQEDFQPSEGDGFPFLKFVERSQRRFPIAFEVVLGYSSRSEDVSISEGERFIAHFLKRTKVFTIDSENKEQHTIPLNTSFQFALLHDPNNNQKEALSGFVFKTAGDMMISRALPKVVRAKKNFRGISPESCVVANELLFIKEVVQNDGERKYIKCIQVTSGKEKHLHEECLGEFSTAPHEVRVYLPDILKHFQLPLAALMCMGPDNEEDIPSHLVSTVVTISTARVEESLIASSITDDGYGRDFTVPEDLDSVVLNDIPLNFDINVNPFPLTPMNAEKVLKLTEKLYETFTPSSVYPYLANYSRSQLSLIKSVRKENGLLGISLIETEAIREARLKTNEVNPSSDSKTDHHLLARIQQLELEHEKLKQILEHILGGPINEQNLSKFNLSRIHNEQAQLKQELNNLKTLFASPEIESTGSPVLHKEANQKFLSTLDVDEVCELLKAMNLESYITKFQVELISGDLLLELSEDILLRELGMEKGVHRMKLLKLISGEYSAKKLLSENSSYIRMVKP